MTYKEKIVDIEGDRKKIPVCLVCATCVACDFCQPFDTENWLRPENAMFCRLHEKQVDYYQSPCNDFR